MYILVRHCRVFFPLLLRVKLADGLLVLVPFLVDRRVPSPFRYPPNSPVYFKVLCVI